MIPNLLDLLDSEDKDAQAKETSIYNNFDECKKLFPKDKESNKHTESFHKGEDHTDGDNTCEDCSYRTSYKNISEADHLDFIIIRLSDYSWIFFRRS